jgi:hypothetical protein
MNGDIQELMTYIGELHNQQMEKLGDLSSKFSEHKGNIEARVRAVEKAQEKAANRQWIHTAIVIPVIAIIHGVANHFGIKI